MNVDSPNRFANFDHRFQPVERIEGYKETFLRTPSQPRIPRPQTLTDITGPGRLETKLTVGTNDLSRISPTAPRAVGQLIMVTGRLLDEDARPIRGSVVEMWQANAAGRYVHKADAANPAPIDPNFIGSGRMLTDGDGRFQFLTIKPGAYPILGHPTRWWRPPHIHFSVFGEGFLSRLVTQMFFPGDPLNEHDLILNAIPDPRGRAQLVSRAIPMMEMPMLNVIGYEYDIVVRGERATPSV